MFFVHLLFHNYGHSTKDAPLLVGILHQNAFIVALITVSVEIFDQ